MTLTFSSAPAKAADTAIAYVYEGKKLGGPAAALDKKTGGFLRRALQSGKFSGKTGETLVVPLPAGAGFDKLCLLGLGKPAALDAAAAEMAGGRLCTALQAGSASHAWVLGETPAGLKKLKGPDIAAHIAAGLKLRAYKFDRYKSKKPGGKEKTPQKLKIGFSGEGHARAAALFRTMEPALDGVCMARDLVNEPPNRLNPVTFAAFAQKTLKPLGVTVEVFDEKRLEKMGMGGILAVGMGSETPPRLIVMRWNGKSGNKAGGKGAKKSRPLALVGKGITFDTGGISIKPGAGMEEMKMDMGGGAAVVGTMAALAVRKAKTDVVGVVAVAENMPSGKAYRPGDILTSYSGKTIEILNTDAEGRLVLADALTYVQKTYKPVAVIDLATLTGAMMIALGHEYCGTFVNDDALWKNLDAASRKACEKLWRMPLDEAWKKDMESPVADLQNLGKSGRFAGACTAAGFLEHFIEPGTPWAHLDIAGTAWSKIDRPTVPKFGSGFGVRLLDTLIRDVYED